MPNKPLQAVSITNPGFFGLNIQDSGVGMNPAFTINSVNSIVDKSGRIAARKGWQYTTTSGGTSSSPRMIFEFDTFDGSTTIVSAGDSKLFTGETTMTQANIRNATNTANLTVSITSDNWQMVQGQFESGLNRSPHGYLVQKNHPVLVYHKLPNTGTGAQVTVTNTGGGGKIQAVTVSTAGTGYAPNDVCTVTGGTGTGAIFTVLTVDGNGGVLTVAITDDGDNYTNNDVLTLVDTDYHSHEGNFGFQRLGDVSSLPAGYSVSTFQPNCALSAFGRTWFANIGQNKLTVYYSVLLDTSDLAGTGSGFINLEAVVPGDDEIIALAEHNKSLVIFCRNNIVIYQGVDDIQNLTLKDTVVGIGCIARDSVQDTGTDLIFLSDSGVRSLGRTIQEESAPLRDISKNIRDSLLTTLIGENKDNIKSAYFDLDAFYVLRLSNFVYCFDMRGFLEDGSSRVTIWDSIKPLSFCVTKNNRLLLGQTNGIANYTGYKDNTSSYTFTYYTPYLDFGDPSITKILKKIIVTAVGSNIPLDIKWAFDYNSSYSQIQETTSLASVSEYGIAEYGIGEYSSSIAIEQVRQQLDGNGNIIQVGIEALINGNSFSLQKLDIYSVVGRTI